MPAEQGSATATGPLLPPGFRHDILNDLNAVIGFALLLELDLPEGPQRLQVQRLLQAARDAQARAEALPRSDRRTVRSALLVLSAAADPAESDAAARAVEAAGFDPVPAAGAAEAARALRQAPKAWALVLADPGVGGLEALRMAASSVGVPLVTMAAATLAGNPSLAAETLHGAIGTGSVPLSP